MIKMNLIYFCNRRSHLFVCRNFDWALSFRYYFISGPGWYVLKEVSVIRADFYDWNLICFVISKNSAILQVWAMIAQQIEPCRIPLWTHIGNWFCLRVAELSSCNSQSKKWCITQIISEKLFNLTFIVLKGPPFAKSADILENMGNQLLFSQVELQHR